MSDVGFKNPGGRGGQSHHKGMFFFFWNLNSKHFIFMPDWSIINWKQRIWVHLDPFKDDITIFCNNCFISFYYSQPLSASTKTQNIFCTSVFGNNKDLKIWETKKAYFYYYHFYPKGKNLIALNSLSCHPVEIGFWLTVFLYFSETWC